MYRRANSWHGCPATLLASEPAKALCIRRYPQEAWRMRELLLMYCTCCTGLRQALGTFGALVGSAIAGIAFNLSGRNYILTFALSAIPAAAALLITTAVCLPNSCIPDSRPTCMLPNAASCPDHTQPGDMSLHGPAEHVHACPLEVGRSMHS